MSLPRVALAAHVGYPFTRYALGHDKLLPE